MRDSEEDIKLGKVIYDSLAKDYPNGKIPIAIFNKLEPLVRPYLRSVGRRVIYRGPRIHNSLHSSSKASMTMRCDAKFAVLWYNN